MPLESVPCSDRGEYTAGRAAEINFSKPSIDSLPWDAQSSKNRMLHAVLPSPGPLSPGRAGMPLCGCTTGLSGSRIPQEVHPPSQGCKDGGRDGKISGALYPASLTYMMKLQVRERLCLKQKVEDIL